MKGFKEFLLRGNVIDLAVAVVIGAAFTAIVTTIVNALINPLIGAVFNASSLDEALKVDIPTVSGGKPATLYFGAIIGAALNFVIVAAVVYFALVVPVNRLKKIAFERVKNDEQQTPQDVPPTDVEVLLEIRDLLRTQNGDSPSAGGGAHVAPSTAPEGPGIAGSTKL